MSQSRPRVGVLLINTGTPDAPETGPVRRYLREFLSDPRVIDIPGPLRFLLLEAVILPFRPAKSAAAYRSIWMAEGSPLRVHSAALAAGLQSELGQGVRVAWGFQYGNPSIPAALDELEKAGVERVLIAPLFPQYAAASTGSSLQRAMGELSARWAIPSVATLAPFFDQPDFIEAWRQVAAPKLAAFKPDHVLFSFHGLPERHMRKCDPTGAHCLTQPNCCDALVQANQHCYRAQCFDTARSLARVLELKEGSHGLSFQSRLGRTPWIRPFTDEELPRLAKAGVKRLAVMCPAFVADCLETLEEIGIRAREDFRAAGGEELLLVPSLNAEQGWVVGLANILRPMLFEPGRALPAPRLDAGEARPRP